MRIVLCLSCMLLFFYATHAQKNRGAQILNDQVEIVLAPEKAEAGLSEFYSELSVIDARDNNAEIGFYPTDEKVQENLISFKVNPSLRIAVAKWATHYLGLGQENMAAKATLLIVIKKCWLSPQAAPAKYQNQKKLQPMQLGFDPGLLAKFEFYLVKDSVYYPLYRVDSVFTYDKDLRTSGAFYVTESLKGSLKKLFRLNVEEHLKKARKLSFAQIAESLDKKNASPIVHASAYKKGVYKDFNEFRLNAPSFTEYEIRAGEMGDIIYVMENGSSYPLRTAWGYCNGADLFINAGDKYSKLIKCQQTFYFSGSKGIQRKTRRDLPSLSLLNLATDSGKKHTLFIRFIRFYQVDMETGEVY